MRRPPSVEHTRETDRLRSIGLCGLQRRIGRSTWICLHKHGHHYDYHVFVSLRDPNFDRILATAVREIGLEHHRS